MEEPVQARAASLGPTSAEVGPAVPTSVIEGVLAEVLTEILGVDRVSVESHFFDELGADSMILARFCARVRKREGLPPVSMKQVYRHPTIRSLAASISETAPIPSVAPTMPPIAVTRPVSTLQYVTCGALQVLSGLGYFCLLSLLWARGYEWISTGSGFLGVYVRWVLVTGAAFFVASAVPVLAKWALVGRWKPRRIRIWSFTYVRFWIVKTLLRANPMILFVGTPIYVLYLRALGAKIGKRVVILSNHVPACTDLLTIGDDAVVRKDSYFTCYRAQAGWIETGRVTLGKRALVGEMTVLDIDTSLGDGAQIGHSSSLHAGQSVPDGEHRCGSPARQRTGVDYRPVARAGCSVVRRITYSVAELAVTFLLLPLLPVAVLALSGDGLHGASSLSSGSFYVDSLLASFVLFFGFVLVGLLWVFTVPRLLNLALDPDKVYPLYGFHYWAHRTIGRMSNVKFFTQLFGDSSYVVHYLRCLGYDLSRVVQTGSNFGTDVKHDNPFLVTVGSGTMVADGLSSINADYSSTSFRLSRVTIGADNFLGNRVAYPSQGKTGDNCLLATKVMVPLDGEVREGVGLLGSPSFEIPRTVLRDTRFDHLNSGEERDRRLVAKDKHNLATIGLYLLSHWSFYFLLVLLWRVASSVHEPFGAPVFAVAAVVALLLRVVYFALVERASTGFRDLRPRHCSIYEPYFWFHERHWKLMALPDHLMVLDGTPLKGLAWRMLGARIGRRLFDDGSALIEKTLIEIGDDCTLNVGSIVQPHSQEDGGFKSDRIAIGAGCTIGTGSWVHYGATMGEGAELGPGAFLMKGEEVPARTRWAENPAREIRDPLSCRAATTVAVPARPTGGGSFAERNGGRAA